MIPVLSRAQMRAFDAHAIEQSRVPSIVLMENAGRGAADVLARELFSDEVGGVRATVVCGTGNNGGDGLVVARRLAVRGAKPTVFLAGDPQRISPDARANLEAWRGIGGEVRELRAASSMPSLGEALADTDVAVDALFGTGLDRPVDGLLGDVVRTLNAARTPCFAMDLPSGLDADTGAALGVAIEATATATFAHAKLGLFTPNGARLAGRVHVVDIGVPGTLVSHLGRTVEAIQRSDLRGWMSPRAPGAHKNSAGHVVVVAGSPGKIGAPQLVARGAMRAGAGLATIATWPEAAAAIESNVLEVMTARIDPSNPSALDAVLQAKQAVVVGPGLGLGEDARRLVEHLLTSWQGPIVVDADALSSFAGAPGVFSAAKKAVLTPHPGELGRILGRSAAQVEADRYAAARDLVAATGAVVVLKGAYSIIASPDGRVAVAPVACPVLATAGSGDVLGGIVAAMMCSLPPFEGACAGVMLHAMAGEAWALAHSGADRGMLASEIADSLPGVVSHLDPHRG
jgi:NAD(P)H-hydrate epimerase